MLGWLLAVLAALVGLFWYLGGGEANGGAANDAGRLIYAVSLGAVALLLAVSIAGDYRGRWRRAAFHGALWLGLELAKAAPPPPRGLRQLSKEVSSK